MAYTRAWTNTTPADTDQASTLGAVTRNLRTDIDERMNTLLGASQWDVDPVAGFPLTKVLYLPPTYGSSPSATPWAVDFGVAGDQCSISSGASGTNHWYVPLILPVGATLTKIRAAYRNTGLGGSMQLKAVWLATNIGTPTVSSLGSSTQITTAVALAWYDAGIANHLVAAGDVITVMIDALLNSTGHYHGLEVTYTMPNLLVAY